MLTEEKLISDYYHQEHCQGKLIVIAATDDDKLNKKVAKDAAEAGALFNAVDQIELCQFIVPAIVKRGDLQIAISTAGKSPALSAIIRKGLENRFGEEYGDYLEELGVLRELIKSSVPDRERRREILIKMAELIYKGGKIDVTTSQEIEEE